MSFLKKFFAPKDPVENLRQLHARHDWATLLSAAKRLERNGLDPTTLDEVAQMEATAGDHLARLNLEEGAWAQRSGERLKAQDHFNLALSQAHAVEIRKQAEQALSELVQQAGADQGKTLATGADCTSCGPSCGTSAMSDTVSAGEDLDDESRMELLLATLPPDLAKRYLKADPIFRKAWLAAQDGDDARAAELLEQVPETAREALFLAERGALLARRGKLSQAMRDLRAALDKDATFFAAFDNLVAILAQSGQQEVLQTLLKQAIAEGRFPAYCWARLAEIHAQQGEWAAALAAGREALEKGEQDPNLLVLCAGLLEREQRLDDAEQLLARLPAGGCGGGAHPLLAEFWLRRSKQLDRALESFKGALRQERDNPRWPLRIAQVYLAKGWTKDAAAQLEQLLGRRDLPEELQAEIQATADQLNP